jgi:surfeit locus 1 family protein
MTPALHSSRFWLLTAAALLVAGSTFSLGQWQLRRAAQKEALQAAVESKGRLPALDARSLLSNPNVANEIHRRATLKGTWRPDHTVYLDNRPMAGKTGFVVLTPLVLDGTSQAIVVQRGWVPRDFGDRTRLPEVTTPTGTVTVEGRISASPSRLYEFKGIESESGRIRQNLDLPVYRTQTGLPLLDVSLLQTGSASEGLLREWAVPNLGVDKHYGYAFQWFGLCALVFILYGWFQLVLPFRARIQSRRSKSRDQLP